MDWFVGQAFLTTVVFGMASDTDAVANAGAAVEFYAVLPRQRSLLNMLHLQLAPDTGKLIMSAGSDASAPFKLNSSAEVLAEYFERCQEGGLSVPVRVMLSSPRCQGWGKTEVQSSL